MLLGSALSTSAQSVNAFLVTNTAAAMAMISWIFLDGAVGRKLTATVSTCAYVPLCVYVCLWV